MRAVVIGGPRSVRVDEVEVPRLPDARGAVIEVHKTAICGSDLHFYDGDLPVGDGLRVGHEFVGTVAEVGHEARSVSVGDRVLASAVAGCGECPGCSAGDPVRCERGGPRVFGGGGLDGGQAEAVAVPVADFHLLAVPDDLDDEAALLLTDNLPTGWTAARRADIDPGATVAVIGLGPVGLCAVQSAIALGAGRVLAADLAPGRRRAAARLGAEAVDPAVDGGTAAQVAEATSGLGAQAVIEAVGSDATMTDALAAVRAGGTVSVVGVHGPSPFPLPALTALYRSITLRLTTAPIQQTWGELLPMLANGLLKTDGIFTHRFALEDAADAYAVAASRGSDSLKVALEI